MSLNLSVCACVCSDVRLCARASVFCRSIGKASVRTCAACACVRNGCAFASALCGRRGGTAGTGGINSSAGGCVCAVAVWCHRPAVVASAAGITWTSRTTSAPWAARFLHTSVVGAAGAIYVIGGSDAGGGTVYQDVWASTDGGARDRLNGGVVKEYN